MRKSRQHAEAVCQLLIVHGNVCGLARWGGGKRAMASEGGWFLVGCQHVHMVLVFLPIKLLVVAAVAQRTVDHHFIKSPTMMLVSARQVCATNELISLFMSVHFPHYIGQ